MSRNYHKSIVTQTSLSLFRFNRKIGFNTASKSLCTHVQLSCFCALCRNHQKCATTNDEKVTLFLCVTTFKTNVTIAYDLRLLKHSPLSTSSVIESEIGLGRLIPISLLALTRNWYVAPGVRSSISVLFPATNGTAACHTLTPVSLYSTVYAVISLPPSNLGGSQCNTSDDEVISLTQGFEGGSGTP